MSFVAVARRTPHGRRWTRADQVNRELVPCLEQDAPASRAGSGGRARAAEALRGTS
jgi:hypothetical protein